MKITVFPVLVLLISCTAIQQISNEKIETNKACSEIYFFGRIPLIPLEIDGQKTNFMFDTGATGSCLLDSIIIKDFTNKKFGTLISAKGADGKKVKTKFMTFNINSNLFISENKVLTYFNMPTNICIKTKRNYTGIIGLDVFFDKKLSLKLDFTNNKVCNISQEELQQFLLRDGYQLLKSKSRINQITIYMDIEGNEYPFKLDTGYTGSIIMPYNEKLNFQNDKKIELEGSLFQTISSHTSGKELAYEKMPISFAGQNLESKVNVSSSIKSQVVGIEFIKAFDWLIDYNNNKVYVKRNQNKIESAFSRKVSYYVKADQDQLKIVVKEKSQTQYHLGDQIITVNNQKVTAENNCELQDLLNKTDDWSTLQLEVIPAQN